MPASAYWPDTETDGRVMPRPVPSLATCPDGMASAVAPRPFGGPQVRQLALAPQPAVVLGARHAVQRTLFAWKLDVLAETVVLLTSELLANAIEATVAAAPTQSGGEWLALTLRRTGAGVLVEVWDPSPGEAVQVESEPTDESGRGLMLVATLASAWGQYPVGRGKVVWCEITSAS